MAEKKGTPTTRDDLTEEKHHRDMRAMQGRPDGPIDFQRAALRMITRDFFRKTDAIFADLDARFDAAEHELQEIREEALTQEFRGYA